MNNSTNMVVGIYANIPVIIININRLSSPVTICGLLDFI